MKRSVNRGPKAVATHEKPTPEMVERPSDLAVRLAIADAANEASTIEGAMQTALEQICAHTGWPVGHLCLLAGDSRGGLISTTVWHLEHPERFETFRKAPELTLLPPRAGLPGRVLASGKPAWVTDLTTEAEEPQAKQAMASGLTAAFAFPIVIGTEVVGVLEFFSDKTLAPDEQLLALMARVGMKLGRVVARQRERAALQESEMRFRSVVQSAQDAIIAADSHGNIIEWNKGGDVIFGYAEEEMLGKPMTLLMPERYREGHQKELDRFRSTGESRVIGKTLELHGLRKDGSEFPLELSLSTWRTEEGIFYSGIIRDITERKIFEEQLTHQAFHDVLTGLPNRALFMDRLEQALARGHRHKAYPTVLFLDLDHLKVINDSLGHRIGDQLLGAVAQRLQACLRPEDTVARFGGDEFVLLLEGIVDLIDAIRVAERIADHLKAPLTLEGYEVLTTASIGIAPSSAQYHRPDDLLRAADLAMYQAKNKGRARYEIFEPSMNERALQRLELGIDLRRAIEHREFRVYYQLVMAMEPGRIYEVEALVRWEHPRRDLLLPAAFLPLAEETGLILTIGQWVMEEACRQTRVWQRQYPSHPSLVVCVNLSARQFQQATLVDDVARVLGETGLHPASLKLEIAENVVMEDEQAALATMQRLKEVGVKLAIDDFGVGHSSLRHLKQFPLDALKIDRAFIEKLGQDPTDTAIVQAVITVAKSLRLVVTAEGVETASQLAHLRDLGCNGGQGFYFGQPVPSYAFSALLGADPRW